MALETSDVDGIIPDFSGTVLNERYLLVQRIGHGGFSTVYEALDQQIDKQVAVKILNPRYSRSPEYRKRFIQEAKAAARIRHRLLVDVSDQGVTGDGLFYFVMELLRGVSLGERVRDRPGPMPWRFVVDLATELAIALEFAHEHGIVHRDVKPGNVFLVEGSAPSDQVQIKLLDLGIAKIHHDVPSDDLPDTRESQGAPGTPEYMAPEQVREGAKGPSIDLYAVGILMYRLLTGSLPFTSKTPFEVLRMHVEDRPIPPIKRCPEAEIPPPVEALVLRAMEKRPEDRFESAQDLRLALQELVRAAKSPLRPQALERISQDRLLRTATAFSRLTLAAITFMVLTVLVSPALQSTPTPLRLRPPAEEDAMIGTLPSPEQSPTQSASLRPETPEPAPDSAPDIVLDHEPERDSPPPSTTADVSPAPMSLKSQGSPKSRRPSKPPGSSKSRRPSKPPGLSKSARPATAANAESEVRIRIERSRAAVEAHCKKTMPKRAMKDSVTVDVTIAAGKATAKIRGRQSELGKCIKAELEKLKFTGVHGPSLVTVPVKFTL